MAQQIKFDKRFLAIYAIVFLAIVGGIYYLAFGGKKAVGSASASSTSSSGIFGALKSAVLQDSGADVSVCVNTWGGYAGVLYQNGGMDPSSDSRFSKEQGVKVRLVKIDDFKASRDAWKEDQCQVLAFVTADSLPSEIEELYAGFKPRAFMKYDTSFGGDVMIATEAVHRTNDLRGKKIALARRSPSETILHTALESAALRLSDVTIVEAPSATEAIQMFKAGQVDAAIAWSPDHEEAIKAIPGSHVLFSTREASDAIADVLVAKEDYIKSNRDTLTKLVTGWLTGNAVVKSNNEAFKESVRILADAFSVPPDAAEVMIRNAKLATFGDNRQFFGLESGYQGMTGDRLYTQMGARYQEAGMVNRVPAWRDVSDTSILLAVKELQATGAHAAEGVAGFSKPTAKEATAPEIASKPVSINFAFNSAELNGEARDKVAKEFVPLLRKFPGSRFRIVGNTDSVGSAEINKEISRRRAAALVDLLVGRYGFESNRFIPVGNGPNRPIASNDTEEGRAKNRRTDFEIVSAN